MSKHSLLVSLSFALIAAACGGKKAPSSTKVTVGEFVLDMPSTWHDVSSERVQPGQVGLMPKGKPSPLLILSPAPVPMPFDPTDPEECTRNGAGVPGATGAPTVMTLPGGKACVIETRGGKSMTMTVLAVDGRGVMAQCQFENDADGAACDPLVRSLARK